MTGRGSSLEWSSAQRWPSVLRRSSGSKRKKSPKLGSLAAQERQEHEKHEGGAHQCPEVKRTGLTGGGGRQAHDASGREKEVDSGDETWGKGSARSRR
jgi:hypothetical protein